MLELALILLGLVLLGAVVLVSYRRAGRLRKRQHQQRDQLRRTSRPGRHEPVLGDAPTGDEDAGGEENDVPPVSALHDHESPRGAIDEDELFTPREPGAGWASAEPDTARRKTPEPPPARRDISHVPARDIRAGESASREERGPADDAHLFAQPRTTPATLHADPELGETLGPPAFRSIDPPIEFIAHIPGDNVVSREQILESYREREASLRKPHHVYALSHPNSRWRDLGLERDGSRYTDIAMAVQLVDRHGPVDHDQLERFETLAGQLAESLGRSCRYSLTREEAERRAEELDALCKRYDALAIVNIVPEGPQGFSGREVDRAARRFGMQFGDMNIYHKRSRPSGGRQLYSMANLYEPGTFDPATLDELRTQGLTVFMNIPATPDPLRTFEDMVRTARGLCEALNGTLVDQERNAMNEEGLRVIGEQIRDMAESMERDGISPGGDAAVRLF